MPSVSATYQSDLFVVVSCGMLPEASPSIEKLVYV